MYMQGYKCNVTNSVSNIPLATPKPAVWCEGNPGSCTKGAKQLISWNQAEANNIVVDGFDQHGQNKSPGYNSKCGFSDGEFVIVFFSLLFFFFFFLMDRNRCPE
jgi:hypothetical protein